MFGFTNLILISKELHPSKLLFEFQKDETSSGKVLELVCLLKRKDNRTYAKFIDVMNQHDCTAVASFLKLKSVDSGKI